MRVLLINPPSRGIYHRLGFALPPLGTAYLAGALRRSGHQVVVADGSAPGAQAEPDPTGFDLVGITADTGKYLRAVELGRRARQAGVPVVVGGPHVTFQLEEALTSDGFDWVLRGEAEESLLELVQRLEAGEDPVGIPGLAAWRDGRVVGELERPPPEDLDALAPPARDLLPMDAYRGLELRKRSVTSLITTRGCPHACSFCCSSRFAGRRLRQRSPDSVLAELEEIRHRWNYGGAAFLDDGFAEDEDRLSRICQGIRRRKLDLRWWCFARADALLDRPELTAEMGASGARYVFVGLESPRVEDLDRYGKGRAVLRARELTRTLARSGIEVMGSYIIGTPEDTRASIRALARTARRLPLGSVQFSILTPFPGTVLWDELAPRLTTRDWDQFDCLHPTFKLDHLAPEELRELLVRCYTGFYLTPRRVLRGLLSSLRGRGVKVGGVMRAIRELGRDEAGA